MESSQLSIHWLDGLVVCLGIGHAGPGLVAKLLPVDELPWYSNQIKVSKPNYIINVVIY